MANKNHSKTRKAPHVPPKAADPAPEAPPSSGAAAPATDAPQVSWMEGVAHERISAEIAATVRQMSIIAEFCGAIRPMHSPAEVAVGPLAVVIQDGEFAGVRVGYNATVDPVRPLELMEWGAFLYAVGVRLRNAELLEELVEGKGDKA